MRTFIFFLPSFSCIVCFYFFSFTWGTLVHVHGVFFLSSKSLAVQRAHIAMKYNTFHETSYLLCFHIFIVMFEKFFFFGDWKCLNWCLQCLCLTPRSLKHPSMQLNEGQSNKHQDCSTLYLHCIQTRTWFKNDRYSKSEHKGHELNKKWIEITTVCNAVVVVEWIAVFRCFLLSFKKKWKIKSNISFPLELQKFIECVYCQIIHVFF